MNATAPPARLKTRYLEEIRPALIGRFGYSSVMQAPKLEKITVNMGVGLAKQDSKVLKAALEQLAAIAGQQPSVRRSRKSIAAFKLREGMPVGVAVTLRSERGYEFLDRLVSIAIPRIRDFRGLNPRSFDGRGNYSLGVREQIIFPEIDYDAIDMVRGLDITITTSAATDVEAFALLSAMGMPGEETTDAAPERPEPAAAAEPVAETAAPAETETEADADTEPEGAVAAETAASPEPEAAAEQPEAAAPAEPEAQAAAEAEAPAEPEAQAAAEAEAPAEPEAQAAVAAETAAPAESEAAAEQPQDASPAEPGDAIEAAPAEAAEVVEKPKPKAKAKAKAKTAKAAKPRQKAKPKAKAAPADEQGDAADSADGDTAKKESSD
jgi:large subunit ribosomal protein L5